MFQKLVDHHRSAAEAPALKLPREMAATRILVPRQGSRPTGHRHTRFVESHACAQKKFVIVQYGTYQSGSALYRVRASQ